MATHGSWLPCDSTETLGLPTLAFLNQSTPLSGAKVESLAIVVPRVLWLAPSPPRSISLSKTSSSKHFQTIALRASK